MFYSSVFLTLPFTVKPPNYGCAPILRSSLLSFVEALSSLVIIMTQQCHNYLRNSVTNPLPSLAGQPLFFFFSLNRTHREKARESGELA